MILDLLCADLTNSCFDELGTFDYIIAHGMFSWVTEAVREIIFRICSEYSKTTGLAYISFNVLPGWHIRRIVREFLLNASQDQRGPLIVPKMHKKLREKFWGFFLTVRRRTTEI